MTANNIADGAPPTLDNIVGQRRAVRQLKTAIEAVFNDRALAKNDENPSLGHILLVGPPGVGKSMLAQMIAKELGVNAYEEMAQNLWGISNIQGFLMMPDAGDVVFVDELHELPPIVQTTLYRALEEQKLFFAAGKNGDHKVVRLPRFSFVAATTDQWSLAAPLRDRFSLIIHLEHYSPEELTQILHQRTTRCGWDIKDDTLVALGKMGMGTPRLALRLLESARRVARAEASEQITDEHVHKMREIDGIDLLGLDPVEQRYLFYLVRHSTPVRLNVIATQLGLPRQTLESIIEPKLIRLGLLGKDSQGRYLTPNGRQHAMSLKHNLGDKDYAPET